MYCLSSSSFSLSFSFCDDVSKGGGEEAIGRGRAEAPRAPVGPDLAEPRWPTPPLRLLTTEANEMVN